MKDCMRRRNYTYEIYLLMSAFCVLIVTQTAYAQFKKGDRFLGGSFQIQHISTRNEEGEPSLYKKEADLSISPLYGKFITDKLAMGVVLSYGLGIQNKYQENQYPEKDFYQWYQPGLFLRRYFPMGKTIGFILDGGINYQFIQWEDSDYYLNRQNISKSDMQFVVAAVSPVFVFFPTPLLGFEVSPGGFYYRLGISSGGLNTHSFQLVYGGLNLGLNYYFRKKEKATVVGE
jgi:hypothetical protein